MGNARYLSVMQRGRELVIKHVTGKAGEKGGHSPHPGSPGRTSTTHLRHGSGGVEIQNVVVCALCASGHCSDLPGILNSTA